VPETATPSWPRRWITCGAEILSSSGSSLGSRTVRQLIEFVEDLRSKDVEFRSITDDRHSHPVWQVHVPCPGGSWDMNRERTSAGLVAARARGRKGGTKPKLLPDQVVAVKAPGRSPDDRERRGADVQGEPGHDIPSDRPTWRKVMRPIAKVWHGTRPSDGKTGWWFNAGTPTGRFKEREEACLALHEAHTAKTVIQPVERPQVA
jgi:hypothetical protein